MKQRVRALTRRTRGISLEQMVGELATLSPGVAELFRVPDSLGTHSPGLVESVLWAQWKHVGRRRAELERRGVSCQ
jgi:hypothetical protein